MRDDDFEIETERRRRESSPRVLSETKASLGGYNVSETLVEETVGLVSLAKASFSRFFVDRLYRQMFGVFLPGFPGVEAEHGASGAPARGPSRSADTTARCWTSGVTRHLHRALAVRSTTR